MKNRPLLILSIATMIVCWILFQNLGGLDGFTRDPATSFGVSAIFLLIFLPLFWFRYGRMKREPTVVEIQDRDRDALSDPRLDNAPIVLVASRAKVLTVAALGLASAGVLTLLMWAQPGVCRVVGVASTAPFLVAMLVIAAAGLLKPERLEIASRGLTYVSPWRSQFWAWDEIRNISVLKARASGSSWTSGIVFNRFAPRANASGPARPMLRPIWPLPSDELAMLLNDARQRWPSATGSTFVPAQRRPADYLGIFAALAALGVIMFLLIGRPCGV